MPSRFQPIAGIPPDGRAIRVVSWNLLRLLGARVRDVAALVERTRPDLLLMQEVTADIMALPNYVGGFIHREPMESRVYGLGVWSPQPFAPPLAIPLPASRLPGRVPPRLALVVRCWGASFANVHLSHGQFLNRLQLLWIMRRIEGPLAIIGDYNAVGPIRMRGFCDIGPKQPTHTANIIPFRLDRCLARGLYCRAAEVAPRGPSDHHPIVLDLTITGVVQGGNSLV